jgi:hypothetical protein
MTDGSYCACEIDHPSRASANPIEQHSPVVEHSLQKLHVVNTETAIGSQLKSFYPESTAMTLNPENEKHLDELAQMCAAELEGDTDLVIDRATPLLKALLMSGYARNAKMILQVELEERIKKLAPHMALNRGAAINGVTGRLQTHFNHLKQWESSAPQTDTPAKPANISSATDA